MTCTPVPDRTVKSTGRPAALLFCALLLAPLGAAPPSEQHLPLLVQAAAVKALSPAEAARGYPVRLRGLVRYHNPELGVLNLQDPSGGVFIELKDPAPAPEPGDWVEIEGRSAPGTYPALVRWTRIGAAPPEPLPPARRLSLSRLDPALEAGEWMELEGIVHNAYQEGTYTILEVYEGKQKAFLRLRDSARNAAGQLVDSIIRVQGVLAVSTDSAGRPVRLELWVPKQDDIRVLAPPPMNTQEIPVTAVGDIEKAWAEGPPLHRIRIQGTVMPGQTESMLLVRDKTGTLPAQPLFTRPISPGDEVELVGFADPASPTPRIINAVFLRISAAAIESAEEEGLPLLTRISRIRSLSGAEAARGYPVRIRGVISYHNPQLSMTFLQSGPDAIYLNSLDPALELEERTEYEVRGFSAPGDFAPIVTKPEFRTLGPAPLPPPIDITLDQLSTGRYDCRRVRVGGVIRAVHQVGNRWRLELFGEGKTIELWLSSPVTAAETAALLDSEIRATGVCSIQVGRWGNISGFRLNVPSIADIQVEKRPPFDPFSAPLSAIRNIFRTPAGAPHRVRIEGVLLHQQPGALYIRDRSGTLSIPIRQPLPVNPSDILSVSGYPAPDEFAPTLEHPLVKRVGSGPAPLPRTLSGVRELPAAIHGDLVRLRGRLVDQWHGIEGHTYILQDLAQNPMAFEAFLPGGQGTVTAPALRNGSELELTGISLLTAGGADQHAVRFLLRTPEDIRVLKNAPWWNMRHTLWAIGLLLLVILLALGWAGLLKARVHRQTRIIRQRLEIEAALERRYRELFEGSNDIVFSCEATGRIGSVNPAATRILGYPAEELLTMKPLELVAPQSRAEVLEWIGKKIGGEDCGALECELRAREGHPVMVEVNGEILSSGGVPAGGHGIARDITGRKEAERALHRSEEKLRQAQKIEAVGNLAGGIAHDFNNILSAILGYAELSEPDLPPGHPVSENLGQISRAARRARDVVNQILAFSRRLEHPRRPTHLKPVLEEALDLLRATLPATIEITTDIAPDCPPVLADSTQMHQVVVNLATNAAHALKDTGGEMHLTLKPVRCPAEGLPDLPPGDYVCLSVCDTGPGIDSAIQKRIFDPYFTTKPAGEGSGLGLAVVHGIVQAHGGRVHLDSEPGKGTCFHICLPRSADLPAADGPPAPAPVGGSGRILFVDDEETLVKLGRRFLEKLGYEVTGETSSRRALELFSRDPGRFDLIVTDQTMPQLTGMSLAESVWRLRPGLPIVISTGYSEQISPERSSALGFSALLPKPYSLPELSQAVEHCMEKGAAGQNTG